VEGRLIVELKAAKTIADEHVAQVLGYLKASRIEHGLLVNFGSFRFHIRKFILSQGKVSEEGVDHAARLMSFLFAFFAFFRG